METNITNVYAAGDVAEYNGQDVWYLASSTKAGGDYRYKYVRWKRGV